MTKIDVFAHVLLPDFYRKMLEIDGDLPKKMPFIKNPVLMNMAERRRTMPADTKQIISYVNPNLEDYLEAEVAAQLVREANAELLSTVRENSDIFAGGVAMLSMNNIPEALDIIENFVQANSEILGVQLFTRHLGKSLADQEFRPIFEALAKFDLPVWLHPVFDSRKPDNNIIFSWEYEQTQAMLQLVQAGYFQDFSNLKIIVHHAGAMAPYFAGRIEHILPAEQVADFKKFYVDTALLGNPKALELCLDYFGADQVLYGTDAPLGILPAGAGEVIARAIEALPISPAEKTAIFSSNAKQLLKLHE